MARGNELRYERRVNPRGLRFVVFGAAGQAREMEWYLRETHNTCVGFVVSDTSKLRDKDDRTRVLGDFSWLSAHRNEYDAFALGIGTPQARVHVANAAQAQFPTVPWPLIAHPSAVVDLETIEHGIGVMLGAGAVVTTNVRLDDFCMVNFGALIGHDARIGRGAVINPGSKISGGVVVDDEALVGAGATVLQFLRVGARARVGAGAVVTRDVPPDSTVVGVPAREVAPARQ